MITSPLTIEKAYTFRKIQAHANIPDITCWYWYITSFDDLLLLGEKVTSGIATSATLEVMKRLHKNEARQTGERPQYPIKGHFNNQISYLIEGRLQAEVEEGDLITLQKVADMATDITFNTKVKVFFEKGHLYVGQNLIGFCFDVGQKILEERTVDKFAFPEDDNQEVITIGKWPDGNHFYIKSNKQRTFPKEKYNTHEAAEREALKHTSKEYIRNAPQMPFIYSRIGD